VYISVIPTCHIFIHVTICNVSTWSISICYSYHFRPQLPFNYHGSCWM